MTDHVDVLLSYAHKDNEQDWDLRVKDWCRTQQQADE